MRRVSIIIVILTMIGLAAGCTRDPEGEQAGDRGNASSPAPGSSQPASGVNPRIVQAAIEGDTATVTSLIDSGTDINTKNAFGVTPLMAASATGKVETVKALLAQGADVSIKDVQGLTARKYAENSGHREIVDLLSAAGARE